MNKIRKLLLIGFFTVVINGCTGTGTKTLRPVYETLTPTPPPIAPTATLTSRLEMQQLDVREDWRNSAHARVENIVNCDACHQLQNGIAAKDISWWNQITSQYESVADSNDLCVKCHTDPETAEKPHAGQACTDCHNPHSTAASCSNSTCHESIKRERVHPPSTPTGGQHPNAAAFCGGSGCHPAATQAALSNHSIHGSTHVRVSCTACHDASGLKVGLSEETGMWVTFQIMTIAGAETTKPYESHNLQIEVNCARCHFEGNSWGLPLVTGEEFR